MTTEERKLLIKDLTSRLPYGVVVEHKSGCRGSLHTISTIPLYDLKNTKEDVIEDYICLIDFFGDEDWISVDDFKPYLFPLSSMTEEQKYEYDELIHSNNIKAIEGFITSTDCSAAEIDWLCENHFDYRGLIPTGLANDATGLNVY